MGREGGRVGMEGERRGDASTSMCCSASCVVRNKDRQSDGCGFEIATMGFTEKNEQIR